MSFYEIDLEMFIFVNLSTSLGMMVMIPAATRGAAKS